jgi:hypothetical protein
LAAPDSRAGFAIKVHGRRGDTTTCTSPAHNPDGALQADAVQQRCRTFIDRMDQKGWDVGDIIRSRPL